MYAWMDSTGHCVGLGPTPSANSAHVSQLVPSDLESQIYQDLGLVHRIRLVTIDGIPQLKVIKRVALGRNSTIRLRRNALVENPDLTLILRDTCLAVTTKYDYLASSMFLSTGNTFNVEHTVPLELGTQSLHTVEADRLRHSSHIYVSGVPLRWRIQLSTD